MVENAKAKRIDDHFRGRLAEYWRPVTVGGGEINTVQDSVIFAIEGAQAGALSDAEIGDYHHPRRLLPWQPPLEMEARARFSHPPAQLLGTAGFGFWNNPFVSGQVVASPNALWFFFASLPSQMGLAAGNLGHGWKAYSLNSGNIPSWLMSFANLTLRLPLMRSLAYATAQIRIQAAEKVLEVVAEEWHNYHLVWRRDEAIFRVDGQEVLRAPHPPAGPLGFVAWMDNQFAVLKPSGEMQFGMLAISQRQWLEIDYIKIHALGKGDRI